MVESYDRVEEHEERFGNVEDVLHLPGRAWLEVSNTIIAHIANGPSSEWR